MIDGQQENDNAPPPSERDAQETPEVMHWRWTKDDRALFLRVKQALMIKGNTDVLRFALGAAERELARSGAGRPT